VSSVSCMYFLHMLPHQFGVIGRGGCEAMVHGIWVVLNIHLDWVTI